MSVRPPAAAAGLDEAAVTALIDAAVAALVDAAPGALDTLNELAAALGDDADFAATITTALAGKQPVAAAAAVVTSETTTSATFADLATVGPAVTVTVPASGKVWVDLSSYLKSSGSNAACVVGVAVSGATTRAADDDHAIWDTQSANFETQQGGGFLLTGLTPGSNTFTCKYRTSSGTGTFKNRNIKVAPLP